MAHKHNTTKPLLNYSKLQNALGYIGFCLPVVLIFYSWALRGQQVEESVSAYYHTHMGDYFVASGCLLGVILLFYKGYDLPPILKTSPKFWQRIPDRWISSTAGISAIVVGLVPIQAGSCAWLTDQVRADLQEKVDPKLIHCADSGLTHSVDIIHYIAAGLFLVCIAFFCLLLFTRGNGTEANIVNGVTHLVTSPANRFFITCGCIILICVAYLAFEQFLAGPNLKITLKSYRIFFWVEVVSIWTFAFAWLEQGRSRLSPFGWFFQR